jgi:hypothetical protein
MFRDLVRVVFAIIGWMIPRLLQLLRWMFFLSATSITSLFVGVPTSVERMADSWIADSGLPLDYREGIKAVAYVTLVLGWLVIIALIFFVGWLIAS